MKKLLQIGAGNIGRGFIARLFYNNGYEVSFADVNAAMVDALAADKKFTVEIVQDSIVEETVAVAAAINSSDQAAFNAVFNTSHVVTTAVGATILPFVARNIAAAIEAKHASANNTPVTIIACENYIRASSYLKKLVLDLVPADLHAFIEATIVFADAAVDCIVPPANFANPTTVRVEEFYELVVDQLPVTDSTLLAIEDIVFTDQILSFVERKLFTLNAAHAATAYVGYMQGYSTIDTAIADPAIRAFITKVMEKNGELLCAKHGFDAELHAKYIQKILKRFDNSFLNDDVARVGREVLRKLSSNERLISPLNEALTTGVDASILCDVVAIALSYRNASDEDSNVVKRLVGFKSIEAVITFITGLNDEAVIAQIVTSYNKIQKEGLAWVL